MRETIQNALWVFSIVVQVLLTVMMIARRSYGDHRAFFAYISFQAIKSLCLFPLRQASPWGYFWTYWIAELVSLILALAVLQDVFESLVAHERRMKRIGKYVFWTTATAILITVALTIQFSPGRRESGLMTGVLTAEQALRIVQSGLLFCIFGFSWLSKVPWLPAQRAVALGMGIFIAAELLIVTLRQHYGPAFRTGFFILKPLAYSIALAIWPRAFVFARNPRSPQAQPASLTMLIHELSDILQ